MGECPDWYAWVAAAKWLGTDATRLEDRPDGLLWRNRALAGMDAEAKSRETRAASGFFGQARRG